MPGLCLGLELAEDCCLSAFSQLCCRPPALPNPAPSHMVPTNMGQLGQAAGCIVTLFISGVCFPDGLHTQTGCSSSQYQPSVLQGVIQCQERGEPGSCKTVGAEPAPRLVTALLSRSCFLTALCLTTSPTQGSCGYFTAILFPITYRVPTAEDDLPGVPHPAIYCGFCSGYRLAIPLKCSLRRQNLDVSTQKASFSVPH